MELTGKYFTTGIISMFKDFNCWLIEGNRMEEMGRIGEEDLRGINLQL